MDWDTLSKGVIGGLCETDSDWGWLIGDEVLKVSSGNVGIHELEETISIGFLGKSDGDRGWLVGDKVLEVSSGDVSVHKLEETIGIRLLGESDGDWGWLVGNEVLEVSSGDVGVHELEKTIGVRFLGESDGDWGWLVSDEVLKVSSGDVGVHKLEETIGIGFLGESNGDWGWLVSDEVLEVSSGDVGVHKLEETIGIGFLGESNGDWGWLVSDEVLEVSSGDVGIHKLEKSIGIGFHLIELDESLGDWSIGVLNKGNKGLLGDVLTVKLTNVNWGLGLLLGPLWGLVLNGVISIIIREALIDDLGKSLTSIEGLGWWWGMGGLWVSLDHDGHGDVVVIGHILGLLSLSVKDRVEGVVTNNLSEGLEGNGLDGVKAEKGVNGEVNGLDLINWDVNEGSSAGESVGVNLGEVGSGWGSWDLGDEFWALGEDVLLVMVVMVALVLYCRKII